MHVRCPCALPFHAIHAATQLQAPPIQPACDPGTCRAEGVEAFGPAPLTIGLLQIPAGYIVQANVSSNTSLGGGRIGIPKPPSHNHPDLGFELHSLADRWEHD
jgi:hypothetical protein